MKTSTHPLLRHALIFLLFIASLAASAQNNALNFDGTDDYVSSTYMGVSGNAPRSVEAWIRTTANCNPSNGGVQNVIVDYGTFSISQRFTLNLLWSNSVRLEIGGSGVSGTTAVNDGLWHHVAATYDPNASSNNIKLYIDGVLETQGTLTGINTATGTGVLVGNRLDLNHPFNGDIDEVRMWSKVLTATEIANHANKEYCQPDANLTLYYRFNQGTPGGNNVNVFTAFDEFGNGNGTLNNFSLAGTGSNWIQGSSAITNSFFQDFDTLTGCNSVTLPISGNSVTSSGTYTDSLITVDGCDSLYTFNVTIENVDTSVNQNGAELISQALAPTTYQWLDCSNGFAVIAGATGPIFNATLNGEYAVQVTNGTCTDTSACYEVTGIGLFEEGQNAIQLYPNPATTEVTISIPEHIQGGQLRIIDSFGRTSHRSRMETNSLKIPLGLPSGLYMVEYRSNDVLITQKLIIR